MTSDDIMNVLKAIAFNMTLHTSSKDITYIPTESLYNMRTDSMIVFHGRSVA